MMELWRHLRAIALLPTMVLVVSPLVILYFTEDIHIGWGLDTPLGMLLVVLGAALMLAGLAFVGWTVAMFRSQGEGTLAPWDPTRKLVVVGMYRYVRNPMISGVLCVLLGEAALLGSVAILIWFALFFLLNAVYIPMSEERGLEQRFGDEYRHYKEHVPRWLPRLTPWEDS
jgi:protein-S-isoprenylcysteine O-methyltransferase Ste14